MIFPNDFELRGGATFVLRSSDSGFEDPVKSSLRVLFASYLQSNLLILCFLGQLAFSVSFWLSDHLSHFPSVPACLAKLFTLCMKNHPCVAVFCHLTHRLAHRLSLVLLSAMTTDKTRIYWHAVVSWRLPGGSSMKINSLIPMCNHGFIPQQINKNPRY